MNPHDILCLILPSNEPEVMKTHLMTSIDAFKEVAPISTFCLNFQDPYTEEYADECINIIKSYGFNVYYTKDKAYEVKGKGLVPINKIRNDTAELMISTPKFYALIDDDMTFRYGTDKMRKTAGQQYVDAIHYMTFHQRCGVLMIGGTLIKNPPRYVIAPTSLPNSYLTNRGYILKAMPKESGSFLPNEAIDLLGSDEDRLLASYRLYNGFYPAKMAHGRTSHYDSKDITPGYMMYEWNTQKILDENNHGFIRNHYFKDFDGSEYNTRVVDWDHYISVGGIDVYNEQVIRDNSVNYENKSTEESIKEIIEYYERGND